MSTAELLKDADRRMFLVLTREHVLAGRSRAGGWTKRQLALLGVDWPPVKGWMRQVVGMRIAGSTVATFLRLGMVEQEGDLFAGADE